MDCGNSKHITHSSSLNNLESMKLQIFFISNISYSLKRKVHLWHIRFQVYSCTTFILNIQGEHRETFSFRMFGGWIGLKVQTHSIAESGGCLNWHQTCHTKTAAKVQYLGFSTLQSKCDKITAFLKSCFNVKMLPVWVAFSYWHLHANIWHFFHQQSKTTMFTFSSKVESSKDKLDGWAYKVSMFHFLPLPKNNNLFGIMTIFPYL